MSASEVLLAPDWSPRTAPMLRAHPARGRHRAPAARRSVRAVLGRAAAATALVALPHRGSRRHP